MKAVFKCSPSELVGSACSMYHVVGCTLLSNGENSTRFGAS